MRKEVPYDSPYPRPKIKDPASGKSITVPDCSHLYGWDQFTWPPTADPRDLPCEEEEDN